MYLPVVHCQGDGFLFGLSWSWSCGRPSAVCAFDHKPFFFFFFFFCQRPNPSSVSGPLWNLVLVFTVWIKQQLLIYGRRCSRVGTNALVRFIRLKCLTYLCWSFCSKSVPKKMNEPRLRRVFIHSLWTVVMSCDVMFVIGWTAASRRPSSASPCCLYKDGLSSPSLVTAIHAVTGRRQQKRRSRPITDGQSECFYPLSLSLSGFLSVGRFFFIMTSVNRNRLWI